MRGQIPGNEKLVQRCEAQTTLNLRCERLSIEDVGTSNFCGILHAILASGAVEQQLERESDPSKRGQSNPNYQNLLGHAVSYRSG